MSFLHSSLGCVLYIMIMVHGIVGAPSGQPNTVYDLLRPFKQAVSYQGVTTEIDPRTNDTLWRVRPKLPPSNIDIDSYERLREEIADSFSILLVGRQLETSSGTLLAIASGGSVRFSMTSVSQSGQLKIRFVDSEGATQLQTLPSPLLGGELVRMLLVVQTSRLSLFVGCEGEQEILLDEEADLRLYQGSTLHLFQTAKAKNKFNGWIHTFEIHSSALSSPPWDCDQEAQDGPSPGDEQQQDDPFTGLPATFTRHQSSRSGGGSSTRTVITSGSSSSSSRGSSRVTSGSTQVVGGSSQVASQRSSQTSLDVCETDVALLQNSVAGLTQMLDNTKRENAVLEGQLTLLQTCECKVQACIFEGKVYENDQQWYADPCTLCECREGSFLCTMLNRPECRDPCALSPCLNGGTCLGFPGYQNFTCICPPSCAGDRCQHIINVCALSSSHGECTDRLQRYYYDPFLQRCVQFVYSGCGGNENNFVSYQACQEQCLVGACCYRTYRRQSQGDDFTAFSRLIPGHRCEELSLAECRLLGTVRPATNQRKEVTAFHPGRSCEEVECGPADTCTVDGIVRREGETFRSGCQSCRCVSGGRVQCSCINLSVRKEIRDMTRAEIERFQEAVRILRGSDPGNSWETLRDLYMSHIMEAHNIPLYLLWHRVYLMHVERQLQEIDCSITIPYFDFTTDVHDFAQSVIWQPNYFGGDGEGDCVPDHPFRNDSQWEPCLRRSFQANRRLPSKLDVALAMASDDFVSFSECMQVILGHVFSHIGGHLSTSAAPYDPLFLPIQAYVDMLFWQWQKKSGNENSFPNFLLDVPMIPFNARPRDALHLERSMCVSYALPSLGAPCNDTEIEFNIYGFDSEGYNRNGFNRQGLDRSGYNAMGFDRYGQRDTTNIYIYNTYSFHGYNRSGYDRRGYNSYGYNVEGYNRDGYDIHGYDILSFDRYGFDRDGYDIRGYSRRGYNQNNQYDRSGYYDSSGYSHQCVDRQQLDTAGYDRFGFNLERQRPNYCTYGFNGPHALSIQIHVDAVLFAQPKEFLMSYRRTCAAPTREPIQWYEQTWSSGSKSLFRLQITTTSFPTSVYSRRFCFDVEPLITRCSCGQELTVCLENPCERTCGSYPDAVCYINLCGECTAQWYLRGEPVDCGDNIGDSPFSDCSDGFSTYREGTVWRPDPCTTCRCSDGRIECEVVSCPRSLCSHPALAAGECCPTCGDCQYGVFVYSNGQTFTSYNEPCSECTCENGNVECHTLSCPAVSCDYPWTYGDQCCPTCDGCVYDGRVLRNGQAFSYDTCTMCRCDDGDVNCDPIQCAVLNCDDRINPPGSCCPRCRDGCEYEGMSFNNGDLFTPMSNPCLQCSCRDSIVRCHPLPCDPPECNNPISLLGACCPVCTNKCVHDGKQYNSGDVWLTTDQCQECFCRGSTVTCRRSQGCPQSCQHGLMEEGQCCSSCTDCLYNGQVWSNFAEFPDHDGCSYCSCYYGQVTCRRKPCEVPTCDSPIQRPGECCPTCKGCEDQRGTQYSHGERWRPRGAGRCEECVCRESQIICGRIQCDQQCTHPIYDASACCAACDGCLYQNREYGNGDPVYTRDACETCVCRAGSVLCAEVDCPPAPCRNPVRRTGECCPTCEEITTCDYEGRTYADGQEFVSVSDPCLRCTCRSGRADCISVERQCNVRCTHPVRIPSECCPTCRDCEFDRRTVPHGANFRDPDDECQICTCTLGSITCEEQDCPRVSCRNPVRPRGECCPVCPTCVHEGREYDENEPVPTRDLCQTCLCSGGSVECSIIDCPPLRCREPIFAPGQCCPECPEDTCEYEGQTYQNNDEFDSRSNPCLRCICRSGRVDCISATCVPSCTHPVSVPGKCCPECDACFYLERTVPNAANFQNPEDECEICTCQFGSVVCQSAECPRLTCRNPVAVPEECCAQCPDVCEYEGRTYEDGERFDSRQDPCLRCICRSGQVDCVSEQSSCVSRCTHSVSLPNQCCPECYDCDYLGRTVPNGADFRNPDDVCQMCSCESGSIICRPPDCPGLTCRNPITLPDECCPRCRVCDYRGREYPDGAAIDRGDDCETCFCQGGEIVCEPVRCLTPNCRNPIQLPGQCCPECPSPCEYEGRLYEDGAEFRSRLDPCLRCLCRSGQVDCQSVDDQCVTRCTHPAEVPDECCPQCEDCLYLQRTISNRARFMDPEDPCRTCTCEFGSVRCESEECPEVPCRNPNTLPGECCPQCPVCEDNGQEYPEGETWTSTSQSCTACSCVNGRTVCEATPCSTDLACTHPARNPDSCCEECDDCSYDRRLFRNRQQSLDPLDMCRICECRDGSMLCARRECPQLTCRDQYVPDGQCCPRCAKCEYNQREYRDGETFPSPGNPCYQCECTNGVVGCGVMVECAPVTCSHPQTVDCCSVCSGCEFNGYEIANGDQLVDDTECMICGCEDGSVTCFDDNPANCDLGSSSDDLSCNFNGQVFADGEEFTNPRDPCVTCRCSGGLIQCQSTPCPTVPCIYPTLEGCCLVCDSGCSYLNETYVEGEEFDKPDEPCQTCTCRGGNLECSYEVCPELPDNCDAVLQGVDQCCPGCIFELTKKCVKDGILYNDGEIFRNFSSCEECQCLQNVTCQSIQCREAPCKHPVTKHCCQSCDGCHYEGENWVNGSYFADPVDECANCYCDSGNVFCQRVPCPQLNCPHQTQLDDMCCPVCIEVECEYNGLTYGHGTIFGHADDECQECHCDDGNVFCQRLPCTQPQCPYPVRGPCCQTCDGCSYRGTEYSSGEAFEDPASPCQDCECQGGFINCAERECPDAPCGYPVKLSGECCPSCQGCNFGGRSYGNGETFGNPDNACQMCECQYGNVTCEKARCRFAACEYPHTDECGCPICDGCSYGGVDYQDGQSFPDPQNSCRECSCLRGYINCETIQCPQPRCFHPALEPGQCCKTCDSCEYEEQVYTNGQEFIDSVDSCRICSCQDGNVNCGIKPCGRANCVHPMMDECNCPVCDGCMYEDVMVMSGDTFLDPNNVCRDCLCETGTARCFERACPPANCSNPTVVPEECCPVCLEAECLDEPNPCGDCVCEEGSWSCQLRPCPDADCPHPVEGMCCLECIGCTYGGKPWANSDSFPDPSDGCGICTCNNGFVTCEDPVCEPVTCPEPTIPAGRCCPVCVGQCTVDGSTYNNDQDFVPPSDPCQRCTCRNGQLFCSAVECSRRCGHPVTIPGQCCPVCDGCTYEGIDYINAVEFISPANPCHSCSCFNGNVECDVIECPELSCPSPIEVPGACCPSCQECSYEGRTYVDGSTFPDRRENCRECQCLGTRVRCEAIACEDSDCTHPVPGVCCPQCASCLFEENIYNNGQSFRPDNCRECNCLNGNVICQSMDCPELSCANRVRDPGQCCDRCQGCLYEGFEYDSGETWVSPLNLCLTCQCQDGVTMCTEIRCLTPDFCTNPVSVPGQCCPICPGCTHNGVTYQNGQSFHPYEDPCESCVCQHGSLTCVRQSCPSLDDCSIGGIQPPALGECCGTCSLVQEQRICDETAIGRTYKPYTDPCFTCHCTNSSNWACMQDMCPMLMCPQSERFRQKDECCTKCQRCVEEDTGSSYFTGQTWRKPEDPCIVCTCDYGAINCQLESCPVLNCAEGLEPVKPRGLCCPECRDRQVPCYYQGVQRVNGERWTRDDCTICQCVEGEVQCETQRCQALFCAADEVPTLDPGNCCARCTPRPATCIAFGDPHYRTFDGKLIHFQGTCRYVMSMDCTNQDFIVEVKNSNRDVGGAVSWTEEVSVIVEGTQVDLGQSGIVRVDGEIIIPPFLKGSIINIERRGDGYYVNTNVGVKVLWDGSSYVEISIPGSYARRTCGLCGNFNGYPQDDLRTRSDRIVNSASAFGNSWKVPGADSVNCDASDVDPCDSAGYHVRKLANIKCAAIKAARFARCHTAVPPDAYYSSCVYDLCACASSDTCLCDSVAAYASECRKAGIFVNWRDASLCSVDCPTERGLIFDECGPACPRTCINKDIPLSLITEQCIRPCVPGCQCTADKVLHSGSCISAVECPRDYNVNATIVDVGPSGRK